MRRLLGHRLPADDAVAAKAEWVTIVEGENELWEGLSEPYKHTIRAFLVHFQSAILSHTTERFTFTNGSIGNFFFAGARLFFRSLDAAIFLYSRVSRIPPDSLVLPVITTLDRVILGAELVDGTVLRGQNLISHPAVPGTNAVDKSGLGSPLPSPIARVLYLSSEILNPFEHEVFPPVNSVVLSRLKDADAIVYGVGSLFTSIAPSLVVGGVGEAVAARTGEGRGGG